MCCRCVVFVFRLIVVLFALLFFAVDCLLCVDCSCNCFVVVVRSLLLFWCCSLGFVVCCVLRVCRLVLRVCWWFVCFFAICRLLLSLGVRCVRSLLLVVVGCCLELIVVVVVVSCCWMLLTSCCVSVVVFVVCCRGCSLVSVCVRCCRVLVFALSLIVVVCWIYLLFVVVRCCSLLLLLCADVVCCCCYCLVFVWSLLLVRVNVLPHVVFVVVVYRVYLGVCYHLLLVLFVVALVVCCCLFVRFLAVGCLLAFLDIVAGC